MSWSERFVRALEAREETPRFILSEVRLPTGDRIGDRWSISSHSDLRPAMIRAGGLSESLGSYIVAPGFDPRIGAFSVPLAGDITWLMDRVTRGQIVRLTMGFAGWADHEFEPIAIGIVQGLRGRGGNWSLDCLDVLAALGSRRTTTAGEYALFADAGTQTVLANDYTAGVSGILLADGSGFAVPPGSVPCAIRIDPTTGDPFYLTYTGRTSNTLSGVSAAAVHGTTAVDAAAGDVVTVVAYMVGHPVDLAARLLVSTGTPGLHGTHDRNPALWGYAFPQTSVDTDDMDALRTLATPASGSASVSWLSETPQANGGAWLISQLRLSGHFLTTRQGRITVRPVPVPGLLISTSLNGRGFPVSDLAISHRDISAVSSWEAWARDYPVEYYSVVVTSDGGSTTRTEAVSSVPAVQSYPLDITTVAWPNEAGWRGSVSQRVTPWYCRIPEVVEIQCAGHRLAVLSPGDIIPITTDMIPGRLPSTEGGYRDRLMVVSGVSPDWFGASTTLRGYIQPTKADGF